MATRTLRDAVFTNLSRQLADVDFEPDTAWIAWTTPQGEANSAHLNADFKPAPDRIAFAFEALIYLNRQVWQDGIWVGVWGDWQWAGDERAGLLIREPTRFALMFKDEDGANPVVIDYCEPWAGLQAMAKTKMAEDCHQAVSSHYRPWIEAIGVRADQMVRPNRGERSSERAPVL